MTGTLPDMANVDLIGELQRLLQTLPMVEYQRDLIAHAIVKLTERAAAPSDGGGK